MGAASSEFGVPARPVMNSCASPHKEEFILYISRESTKSWKYIWPRPDRRRPGRPVAADCNVSLVICQRNISFLVNRMRSTSQFSIPYTSYSRCVEILNFTSLDRVKFFYFIFVFYFLYSGSPTLSIQAFGGGSRLVTLVHKHKSTCDSHFGGSGAASRPTTNS